MDRVGTFASNFGNQFEHWNGVDLTMNARLTRLLLQGGVSTGRTFEDFCEVEQNSSAMLESVDEVESICSRLTGRAALQHPQPQRALGRRCRPAAE